MLLVPQQLTFVTVPPNVGLAFIMAVTLPLAVHKNWLVNTTVYNPALPAAALLVTVGVCWLLVNEVAAFVVQLYVVVLPPAALFALSVNEVPSHTVSVALPP
jgi:hypothetical protein